jgi:hypothetical protein
MSPSDDFRRDLEAGADLEDLLRLAETLERERPVPAAAFRGALRRRVLGGAPGPARPARLRVLVGAYGGSGVALLLVAAAGLAGAGPFAS